jgi:glycosyltransferase involved in cell wall biosynthesis
MVSIITAVYNSEKYIDKCIESVQAQTFKNWEHIFVDDCSSDDSGRLIKQFRAKDSRIKYHRLEINRGAGIARNKAIELAQGNYIAFLDSDDTWYPDKLEKQLEFMRINNSPFTFTSYDLMDEKGKLLGRTVKARKKVTYNTALFKNPIGCLTAIYDTDFFGKQYMPEIRKRQDFALWLKLLKKSDAFGVQESLASYRIQKNSVSSNKIDLIKYEWRIYRNQEEFNVVKSTLYLLSAIVLKMKSYF